MPQFSVNIVTPAGQALLARASSALQLIYTRIKASETAVTAAEAAASVPADYPVAGTILAASATENVARIVGKISSASLSAAVDLKSFALCAKIDGDAEDAVLAVLSDANASVPLPGPSAVDVNAEIGFLLTITDAGQVTVEVTGAGSVTFGDIARFLSLYKAGDPTTGEAQTVLGAKTFNGALTANGTFSAYGAAYFDDFATFDNGLTANNDIRVNAWAVYGDSLLSEHVKYASFALTDNTGESYFAAVADSAYTLAPGDVLTGLRVQQDSSANTSFATIAAYTPRPSASGKREGSHVEAVVEDGHAWFSAKAYLMDEQDASGEYVVDPLTSCEVYAEYNELLVDFNRAGGSKLGLQITWYEEGGDYYYGLRPQQEGFWELGSQDFQWYNVWTEELNCNRLVGLAPPQQSGNTGIQMAIGAYTMLTLTAKNAQSTPDSMFGTEFTLSSTMEGTSGGGAQKFTVGYKFRAMQTIHWDTSGNDKVATFLAMRVG